MLNKLILKITTSESLNVPHVTPAHPHSQGVSTRSVIQIGEKSQEAQTEQEEWKTHVVQHPDAFPFPTPTLPVGHMQPELLSREYSLHLS